MKTHLVIPDGQVKPNVPIEHWEWLGKFAVDKKPDVIVNLGDFADMPSLSSFDVGKMAFEGRKYTDDIQSAKSAMTLFTSPIKDEIHKLRVSKRKLWSPKMVLTLGNHEERINRAINQDRKLDGLISIDDLSYEKYGWEVHPFLDVVIVDGIAYSHYFTSGSMGRPVASARALTTKKHMSCVMGHVQTTEIDMSQFKADGTPLTSIFAGAFYQHHEDYLGSQGNVHHRGVWMFYEVDNGSFLPHFISMEFLRKKYENSR